MPSKAADAVASTILGGWYNHGGAKKGVGLYQMPLVIFPRSVSFPYILMLSPQITIKCHWMGNSRGRKAKLF